MATTDLVWNAFQGLQPAVDPVQPQSPFVVNGTNFMLDVKGPYSTFYSRIMAYAQLAIPEGSFTFRTQDDLIIATTGCILRYDSATMRYYPVFTFTDPGIVWPWSFANLDNKYYLTKKGLGGVLQYDAIANSWGLLTANLPDGVVGLCSAYGRLVVLGDSDVAWSSQDDGTDFVPDLTTGAGFQGTSLVGGAGYPLCVLETVDGFVTYTAKGCMKSTFVNAAGTPWQHTALSKNYIPLSPFLAVQTDDLIHIILDRKGLFSTQGAQFQPYAPLFSEYLKKTLLSDLGPIINYPILQLYWRDSEEFLFLSVGSQSNPLLFTKAFVYYANNDSWGSFDQFHYGFGELNNTTSPNMGYNFGYLDTFGYYRLFIDDAIIEANPDKSDNYFYQPLFDIPVGVDTTVNPNAYIARSLMHMTAVDESIFSSLVGGIYSISAFNVGPEPANYNPGPDFSAFSTSATYEDWNLIPNGTADEDYELEPDQTIDWGGTDYGVSAACTFSMASEVTEKTSMIVPLALTAPSSYVEIGLLHLTDQARGDELSMITNVSIQCDLYPGFPTFDDYEAVTYTPDLIEDWELIASGTADEDWGNASPYSVEFTATAIGTLDGNTVFENNIQQLTLERSEGEHRYYTCQTHGSYHKFRFDANEIGQSYHVKLLESTATLSGNIA